MKRKTWLHKWRKDMITRQIETRKRIKAVHIFVDGKETCFTYDTEIKHAQVIKITGVLYREALTIMEGALRRFDILVDTFDLSEATVTEENGIFYGGYYDMARCLILPSSCKGYNNHSYRDKYEEIIAPQENPYLKNIDGVLYSKDGTSLIAYPPYRKGKTYTLPAEVKTIEKCAFTNAAYLEELSINEGCLRLERRAIDNCKALKTIHFGHTIQHFGVFCIFQCKALEEVLLPASLQEYTLDAMRFCDNLKRIDVEEGGDTFCSVDGILYNKKTKAAVRCPHNYQNETVTIPDWVTTILSESFGYCCNLKHLHLPKSLETIEPDSFTGVNIEQITIADGNTHFCIEDGILYNADKTTLLYCPPRLKMEEVIVPDTVVRIEEEAFFRNEYIRRMTIPASVKEVGTRFILETNIEKLWLPKYPPKVTEGINDFCANDQYVGYPRNDKTYILHIPVGSTQLYIDENCYWHYLSYDTGVFVEE